MSTNIKKINLSGLYGSDSVKQETTVLKKQDSQDLESLSSMSEASSEVSHSTQEKIEQEDQDGGVPSLFDTPSSRSTSRSTSRSRSRGTRTPSPFRTPEDDELSSACTIDLLSNDPLFIVLSQFLMSKESGDNIVTVLEKINKNLEVIAKRLA